MDDHELFRNLVVMAHADGKVTEEEWALLRERAGRWGIDSQRFEQTVEAAAAGEAELTVPADPNRAYDYLHELVLVVAADGHLADAERRLLESAARQIGLSVGEFDDLLAEVIDDDELVLGDDDSEE